MASFFRDQQKLGAGDVSTELQAILDNFSEIELSDREYNVGSTGLTIPSTVRRLVLPPDGILTYSGTGVAVLADSLDTVPGSRLELYGKIRRSSLQWEDPTPADTTSVGLRLRNCDFVELHIGTIHRFRTGLDLLGDAAGTTHTQIYPSFIFDNRTNVIATTASAGSSNEQCIWGGKIGYTSSVTDFTGAISIDLQDTTLSGWKFFGVSLEGNLPDFVVECNSDHHLWDHCRWDAVGANKVHFGTSANRNVINYGFGNVTPWATLNDEGANNVVNSFAA